MKISDKNFFRRDVLQVAPELVGKVLVRHTPEGDIRLRITETEAYRGEEDTACHAHKGRTKRTETLYMDGGTVYVYLCYGIHWMLNVVTGIEEQPQAVLIRACEAANGPGKLTKALQIDKSFNALEICCCSELWLEDDGFIAEIKTAPRVGIGYASPEDISRPWRFIAV
ncbi:MAG: DNA-3-methyladenine glycosylase [Oscillospiraceae bacterium]|nr:DNA-3-methyladenine glycosylase [Oscillospiraceae bacterium]